MKKIIICLSVILLTGNIAMAQSHQDKSKVINSATGLTQAEKDAAKPSGYYKNALTPVIDSKTTNTKVNKNDPSKYSAAGQPLPAGYVAPKAVENNTVSDKNKQQQPSTGGKK